MCQSARHGGKTAGGVDRGEVPERHLKLAFDSTVSWLEGVFAEVEPMLRVRLLRARPAL